jgi:TldD protein
LTGLYNLVLCVIIASNIISIVLLRNIMSTDTLSTATNILLSPFNLSDSNLHTVLSGAMSAKIDAADLYIQRSESVSWSLQQGIIRSVAHDLDQGFGLRTICGTATGFAYGNDLAPAAIKNAAHVARQIAGSGKAAALPNMQRQISSNLYPAVNPLLDINEQAVANWLKALDTEVRARDTRISEVVINLSLEHEVIIVLNSDGQLGSDIRPIVELHMQVIVKSGDKQASGRSGAGRRGCWEYFHDPVLRVTLIDKAVNQALLQLEAVPAPAGDMPVVLGPGWPSVLFHEAVGHGLEADFNRKETSIYTGRIGERVAPDCVTLVDDATLADRRGSLNIDDEATPGQYTVLIDKGILKNYMTDRLNAKLMGTTSTGNGRRESYAYQPLPRMTNTYLLPGTDDINESIKGIKKGLYAVDFSGGQVDITSGSFVFTASEAYMIENGKISYPVRGATLVGNGPEVLQRIVAVGSDLELDSGIGMCGKDGQSLPVGVGQPSVVISQITVGGSG